MGKTEIEWCDYSWSPISGCTKVSRGCDKCYAARMAKRLAGRFGYPADDPFKVTLHPDRLEQPLRWRKARRIFVCSMGDLFHEDVPDDFIRNIFMVMAMTQQHTYMILTKRVDRMLLLCQAKPWFGKAVRNVKGETFCCSYTILPNVWLGTSAEDQPTADKRIPELLTCPAAVRFLSLEPLIAPVDLSPWTRIAWQCSGCREYFPDPYRKTCPACGKIAYWSGSHAFNPPGGQRGSAIDWVIVGAETGPGARPMNLEWARSIRDQCQAAGVPFFFKNVSGRQPIPDDLMVREFPEMRKGDDERP